MSTNEPMTDSLLSRLTSLTGPDREVDAEIALANGWAVSPERTIWISPADRVATEPPRYTASIDAALPGEDIISTSEQSPTPGQPIKWVAVHRMPKGRYGVSGTGHTEAIARRIAALKAKEPTP